MTKNRMRLVVLSTVLWILYWAFWVSTNSDKAAWKIAVGLVLGAGFLVFLWMPVVRARRGGDPE